MAQRKRLRWNSCAKAYTVLVAIVAGSWSTAQVTQAPALPVASQLVHVVPGTAPDMSRGRAPPKVSIAGRYGGNRDFSAVPPWVPGSVPDEAIPAESPLPVMSPFSPEPRRQQ
jgi:hypothetical protein